MHPFDLSWQRKQKVQFDQKESRIVAQWGSELGTSFIYCQFLYMLSANHEQNTLKSSQKVSGNDVHFRRNCFLKFHIIQRICVLWIWTPFFLLMFLTKELSNMWWELTLIYPFLILVMKTGKSGEARGMWGGIVSFSGSFKNVLFCKLSLAFALIIAESILHIRESEE